MTDEQSSSLMDQMLDRLKTKKLAATVHLKNGIALRGTIMDYDATSVLMTTQDSAEGVAIERSAISSAQPGSQGGYRQPGTRRNGYD